MSDPKKKPRDSFEIRPRHPFDFRGFLRDSDMRWPFAFDKFRLPYELNETEDNLVAIIEIPGFNKSEIELWIDDGYLSVSAQRKEETEEKDERYYRRSSSYKAFSQMIPLPSYAEVNPKETKATYSNGILEIVMPKVAVEKKRKGTNIEIA